MNSGGPRRPDPILPGATLGVLGGGQLGRMFALAARRLGYRVHVLADAAGSPAGEVADREIVARYDDPQAVVELARSVEVITFEFENVDAAAAAAAARIVPVRPGPHVLEVTQDRGREKRFLTDIGVAVVPHEIVASRAELEDALVRLGAPAVLKTSRLGYDGKGQAPVRTGSDLDAAWERCGPGPCVLERYIDFERELSVLGVRGVHGEFAAFGPIENRHRNHILDVSMIPAAVSKETAAAALDMTRRILERLEVVGVLCVELFCGRDGQLLVNELAPRPHNSGHLTIDACATSQFEQQLRAICGLPLGSCRATSPAAMANLLGEIWSAGEPDWARALALADVRLHLYGKDTPRPGRKMGHVTALAPAAAAAHDLALQARAALVRPAVRAPDA